MSSINESILEQLKSMEQSVSEMRKTLGLGAVTLGQSSDKKTKGQKAPKAEKAPKEEKEKKAPNAWNILMSQTVSEMKQSGWTSWTDAKGTIWPASRSDMVKDKSGAESEQYVYDGGEHDGKQPSPALGGMARASYLKQQSEPEHAAKAAAYQAKLAEKRSTSGSVTSGAAEAEPVADSEPPAKKKGGRPKMTDEQKAAAKAKKEAKKAAEAAPPKAEPEEAEAEAEFEDAEAEAEATTPLPAPVAPPAPVAAPKKAVQLKKKLNLNFRLWKHNGETYYKNDRGDLLTAEHSWMGRFNGTTIDESVEEPDDLGTASIEDE